MDYNSQALFNRRLIALSGIMVFCLLVLLSRLFYLQVMHSSRYEDLSNENRIRVRYVIAGRGQVLDRYGLAMAQNKVNFQAILIPEESKKHQASLEKIVKILKLTPDEVKRIQRDIAQQPKFLATIIRNNLSWEDIAKIETLSLELPGIFIEKGVQRDYLMGDGNAHILGYVSLPNKKEAEKDKSLALPGLKIGKMGIEAEYDTILRGVAGQKQVEVNARGRLVKELSDVPSRPGQDILTTMDRDLQAHTAALLAPYKSATAVVMDIHTGGILAMVSTPGFNPHLFFNGIDCKSWKDLNENPQSPMSNKVIAGNFNPGSVFKVMVALAFLQAGIDPEEKVMCPGYMMLGNHRFHCWRHKQHGHGPVNFLQAVAGSCDVYFYQMALRVGVKPILDMVKLFGCAMPTGIDLPGEEKGFIADPAWKEARYKQKWTAADTILTTIGQGYVLMTPIQLVTMVAQVANGGYRVVPHVYQEKHVQSKKIKLNEEHVTLVLQGMFEVVNTPQGTAYTSRLSTADFQMGGKTGTAQVIGISMQERKAGVREYHQIPWHLRDNSLFVGFAPTDNPRYAVAVVGQHEGWGAGFAARTAKAIMEKLYQIEKNGPSKKQVNHEL